MSRCSVPRCKNNAHEIAGLCRAHFAGLADDVQANLLTLADAAKGGGLSDKQAYGREQGRVVMEIMQSLSPMKGDR